MIKANSFSSEPNKATGTTLISSKFPTTDVNLEIAEAWRNTIAAYSNDDPISGFLSFEEIFSSYVSKYENTDFSQHLLNLRKEKKEDEAAIEALKVLNCGKGTDLQIFNRIYGALEVLIYNNDNELIAMLVNIPAGGLIKFSDSVNTQPKEEKEVINFLLSHPIMMINHYFGGTIYDSRFNKFVVEGDTIRSEVGKSLEYSDLSDSLLEYKNHPDFPRLIKVFEAEGIKYL